MSIIGVRIPIIGKLIFFIVVALLMLVSAAVEGGCRIVVLLLPPMMVVLLVPSVRFVRPRASSVLALVLQLTVGVLWAHVLPHQILLLRVAVVVPVPFILGVVPVVLPSFLLLLRLLLGAADVRVIGQTVFGPPLEVVMTALTLVSPILTIATLLKLFI